MNKKDIKKISITFRTFASQAINARYTDVGSRLAQFINYVDDTPLLRDYVNGCISISSIRNVEGDVEKVANSYGNEQLEMGESVEDITAFAYKAMKFLSGKNDQIIQLGLAICRSSNFQDCAKAFGTNIVLPFASNISLFLTTMMIDMGMDENTQYNITVNGGQVNVSQDNSTLNAVFNSNGPSLERLKELAEDITKVIAQNVIPDDNAQKITDALEGILEEMKRQSPKKGLIKVLLESVSTTTALLTAPATLSAAVNSFTEYLIPFL